MNHEDEFVELQEKGSFEDQIIYNAFKNERTIYIWGEINEEKELVVNRMIEKLCFESKDGEKKPIYIKLSSPGGSVHSGLSIVSAIETAKSKGYPVHIKVYGIAMSMGLNIVACCSYRTAQFTSRFLLHDIASLSMGYQSREDVKDSYIENQALFDMVIDLLVRDTNMTREFILDKVERKKEYSFWADEAKMLNLIDEID